MWSLPDPTQYPHRQRTFSTIKHQFSIDQEHSERTGEHRTKKTKNWRSQCEYVTVLLGLRALMAAVYTRQSERWCVMQPAFTATTTAINPLFVQQMADCVGKWTLSIRQQKVAGTGPPFL